jgi:CysZ protein
LPAQVPDLARRGPLDLLRGFCLPFRGLGLVFSTPRLKLLTVAVGAVTLVTLVGLGMGLIQLAPALVGHFWSPGAAWYAIAAQKLLVVLVFGLLFVIGANVVPALLVAPLMDPLSKQAERAIGVPGEAGGGALRLIKETARALANTLMRLVVLLIGHAVLLPLLLVPVLGAPTWSVLGWFWTAIWVAVSYLDVPMARHLYSFEQELAVLKQRFALCLGFGAAISLMLWVPLLNFFFVPVAVVSGTVLFRSLVSAGALPPPADERAEIAPALWRQS